MLTPKRRHFVFGATALCASPTAARSGSWQTVANKARALDRCHALVVHRHGQTKVSEAFRGPSIGHAVPVKSVSKTIVAALPRDPQGRYLGGNEMALSVPAMVRFGELYLNGGRWGGIEELSDDWVARSLRPRTRSFFSGLSYGYGWFMGAVRGHTYALARGYGEQVICIVPGLGLCIAITSDPTRSARSGGYFGDLMGLIERSIIPAALSEGA